MELHPSLSEIESVSVVDVSSNASPQCSPNKSSMNEAQGVTNSLFSVHNREKDCFVTKFNAETMSVTSTIKHQQHSKSLRCNITIPSPDSNIISSSGNATDMSDRMNVVSPNSHDSALVQSVFNVSTPRVQFPCSPPLCDSTRSCRVKMEILGSSIDSEKEVICIDSEHSSNSDNSAVLSCDTNESPAHSPQSNYDNDSNNSIGYSLPIVNQSSDDDYSLVASTPYIVSHKRCILKTKESSDEEDSDSKLEECNCMQLRMSMY